MKCLACGAEMHLRDVVLADIPTMRGFERHTFRCSACPQVARRLVICRAKMPVVDPVIPLAAPKAPASNPAAGSSSPNAVQNLPSTQTAGDDEEAANWSTTVERLTKAIKERAVASRPSAWAKAVEKLRSKQMTLEERAAAGGSRLRTASSTESQACPDARGASWQKSRDCISSPKSPE